MVTTIVVRPSSVLPFIIIMMLIMLSIEGGRGLIIGNDGGKTKPNCRRKKGRIIGLGPSDLPARGRGPRGSTQWGGRGNRTVNMYSTRLSLTIKADPEPLSFSLSRPI